MAAPTPTLRVTPTGFRLKNGYQALLAFELDTDANYYEISVGVPGIDSGDPVENTTQINDTYRTFAPRQLLTLTPFQVTAGYAVSAYSELAAMTGVEQSITVHFPDNSSVSFFGFLQSVEFDPMVDGTMPTMTLTLTPTNYDPDNCVEAGPVIISYGTC